MSFWCVESPGWLLSVGREKEAIRNLEFIAEMNGTKNFSIEGLREEKFETCDPETEKKKQELAGS